MEWLALLPLLFFAPFVLALWRKRRIAEGCEVEIAFDMAMPSKWAAELVQRALVDQGVRARIFREQQTWLCGVASSMKYQREVVQKAITRFDQLASARGGECIRYRVKRGRREEVHACPGSKRVI